MRHGYLIAYTDTDEKNKQPWIHPTHPLRKNDVEREYNFLKNVVKVKHVIPFKVNYP